LPPFPGRSAPPKPKESPRYGRWVAVGITLAFVLALVLLAVFVSLAHRAHVAGLKDQVKVQTQAQAAPIPYDTSAYSVKPSEIMAKVLARAGLAPEDVGRVVPALNAAGFNFRAMRPGDSLFVLRRRGAQSAPRRLLYRQDVEHVYRIDLDSAGARVSMLFRHITQTTAFVKGTITSSLYETMMALGESPQLIMDYTDIFGWEVDFFSEVQKNDSFAILFQRKYCDSVCVGYGDILAASYWGQVGSFSGYRFTDPEGITDYYNADGQNLRKTFQKSPLRFSRVTSFFGRRYHPILRIVREHYGVDYGAPAGAPVEAVADGHVVSAGWAGGYGRLVVLGHAEGYETRYGHLSGFGKGIRSGATVRQGQVVGYVGQTGLATGPHLHYEVRIHGTPTNPLKLNPPRRDPVNAAFMSQFLRTRDSLARTMVRLGSGHDPN